MIGTRVSHYRITGRLGEGGMGVVYEAVDEVLGRAVALKFPSPDLTARQQLTDEARAASRLNHPNVAHIYEYSDGVDGPFIAMELVRGQNLRDLLNQGPLDPAEAVRIALSVAEALEEAHRQDLIHLDIKPGNIAVNERGVVKVLDFGLAKALSPERFDLGELSGDIRTLTMNVYIRGTPSYMSPEQVRGEKLDGRSDLFSLGAVLYECLTGSRAFPGNTVVNILLGVFSNSPPPPSSIAPKVSPKLDAIVLRLLEKDRKARYASAAELAAALREASAPRPTTRLSRTMLAVALACALLLALAVAWRTLRKPSSITVRQLVVLPFENTGPPSQAAFGDGVTEIVTGMLANLSEDLWVVPASDVRRYGVQTVKDAGRTFHTGLVLSGTVRRDPAGGAWDIMLKLLQVSGDRVIATRTLRLDDNPPGRAEAALRDGLAALLQVHARPASKDSAYPALSDYSRFIAARGLLRRYDSGDNLKRAVAELAAITTAEPLYAPAQVAYGEACFRTYSATKETEWLARADQAVRRAADINANEPLVHLMLGRILRATGQYDAAIAELKLALAVDPSDVNALLQLAGVYENTKRPDDAEATYQRIIRLRPSYFPAYMNLGELYMTQGKWQQAEDPLTLVTRLAPDYADGFSALGALEYYQNRLDEAKQLFTRSIEIKPTGSAYANLCGVEYDLRAMDAAAADCRKSVELQPASPVSWGNLADVLFENGHAQEAATTYRKALELGNKQIALNPTNSDLLGVMAKFAAKTGQKRLAIEFADKALSLSSAVRVLYNSGKALGLAGDCARSAKLLKQAFDNGYPRQDARKDLDLNRLRTPPLSCAVPPV